jgi:hypothetical protein
LTFVTLLIHRIRAARAAQRDRAPEDIVRNLPWLVWTGTGWEKHEGGEQITEDAPLSPEADLEEGIVHRESSPLHDSQDPDGAPNNPSTSSPDPDPSLRPWFEAQVECAICLSDFVKGDKVRILPCRHIFHLNEVDEWLIHRKKLVSLIVTVYDVCTIDVDPFHSVLYAKQTSRSLPTHLSIQNQPYRPAHLLTTLDDPPLQKTRQKKLPSSIMKCHYNHRRLTTYVIFLHLYLYSTVYAVSLAVNIFYQIVWPIRYLRF